MPLRSASAVLSFPYHHSVSRLGMTVSGVAAHAPWSKRHGSENEQTEGYGAEEHSGSAPESVGTTWVWLSGAK